jgi:MATE family multidrug resistance protein
LAARLLTVAAFFQVFDGAQTIAAGALRGLKDTRIPAVAASLGYWGIGFTTAWVFGVHLGLGPIGIWWGLASGLASVALLLSFRFWRLSAHLIARTAYPAF